ncbi:MAG: peptidase C45 [Flavobacteriales bacterium]|nr:peptidase C45 [Flavobacteriales bacterium]
MLKLFRNTFFTLLVLLLLLLAGAQIVYLTLGLAPPKVENALSSNDPTTESGIRFLNGNWYFQNNYGLWEAYLAGKPYERGIVFGKLAERQIQEQEGHFVAQIRRMIPSEWFLDTLKYGVAWFNRDLPTNVSEELKLELFGISQSFSPEYEFIGSNYDRILNYHAAHDIGHALQDLSIVGCTSFASWNAASADSSLIIGRNFDFYMGDDFAKDKIILFMRPDSGYAFASITWAGFMGVVSGMNEHGLTVTLNAAKSSIPTGSKTPISILAREILQYARTIDEAYQIAASRETFVSESILIGSAIDEKAAIIEKAPDGIDIYFPDSDNLVCANHYQSERFRNSRENIENIKNSDSNYRFQRMNQLLSRTDSLTPVSTAEILRNQKGLDDAELGMGNPKAINQLLAHHAVIFQPEKRLMWVSVNPFQLGEFLCYDLNAIFSETYEKPNQKGIYIDSLTIEKDAFLSSEKYNDFLLYKKLKNRLFDEVALGKDIEWNSEVEQKFISSNPNSYISYMMLGDHYFESENHVMAKSFYEKSLTLEVSSESEREHIEKNLEKCR